MVTQSCAFCGTPLARVDPAATGGTQAGPGSDAIEAIRLRNLPPGWTETQFAHATPDQVQQFAQSLRGALRGVGNQYVSARIVTLQINYVQAASLEIARTVFGSMVQLVGKVHSVARKGDVVVEIICHHDTDQHQAPWVLELLRPDEVHRPRASRW
jgi:hypothetical protein